jgi:hypothetical protein
MSKFLFPASVIALLMMTACQNKTSHEKEVEKAAALQKEEQSLLAVLGELGVPSEKFTEPQLTEYETKLNRLSQLDEELIRISENEGLEINTRFGMETLIDDYRSGLNFARAKILESQRSVNFTKLTADASHLAQEIGDRSPARDWSDRELNQFVEKSNLLLKTISERLSLLSEDRGAFPEADQLSAESERAKAFYTEYRDQAQQIIFEREESLGS